MTLCICFAIWLPAVSMFAKVESQIPTITKLVRSWKSRNKVDTVGPDPTASAVAVRAICTRPNRKLTSQLDLVKGVPTLPNRWTSPTTRPLRKRTNVSLERMTLPPRLLVLGTMSVKSLILYVHSVARPTRQSILLPLSTRTRTCYIRYERSKSSANKSLRS